MAPVRVGLVGCGFSAGLHMRGYRKLSSADCQVAAVCGIPKQMAEEFAAKHGIPEAYGGLDEMLEKANVDALDLAVPNHLHAPFIIQGARAGKHIFCEKPLTGYFGPDDVKDDDRVGEAPKKDMLEVAKRNCQAVVEAVTSAGVKFGYAENWIYAPGFLKLWSMAKTAGGTILRIEGEESHSGSHAEYAKRWRFSGGGSLMVKGCHPLSAALQLKWWEGEAKFGKPIRAESVLCETGNFTWMDAFKKEQQHYVRTGWYDVEDFGIIIIKFEDGSIAEIKAGDTTLGGIRNYLEAHLSNARLRANLNPNDACVAYAPDADVFDSEYIVEKIETKGGWSQPSPDEEWMQGHEQEVRDFVWAIKENREPLAGISIAQETVLVLYAAYVSAEDGRRVDMKPILAA